jgi:RND family efflux transporter MFP subunit
MLDFTDNQLDPRSGTIRARAVIANPRQFLTPGMFGTMRMSTGSTVDALLVPDTAIQTDQTRKLVLVVGKDGTVTAKDVELGPLVEGLRVIRKGLTTSDRVVIEGAQSARPGGKVTARRGQITLPPAAPVPPASARAAPSGTATIAN